MWDTAACILVVGACKVVAALPDGPCAATDALSLFVVEPWMCRRQHLLRRYYSPTVWSLLEAL